MTSTVLFYFYAIIAVAGALVLVSARNMLHGAVGLLATIIAIAGLYLILGSEFLAAMQLFVYGGAITVLVLFALMLAGPRTLHDDRPTKTVRWLAAAVCAAFLAAIIAVLLRTGWNLSPTHAHDTESIATILFSRYVLPFEIAGLSLTIALIGSIVIAREDDVLGMTLEDEPAGAADATGVPPRQGEGEVA